MLVLVSRYSSHIASGVDDGAHSHVVIVGHPHTQNSDRSESSSSPAGFVINLYHLSSS